LVGTTLGKVLITGLIGQGGMATVYRGVQADVERTVAVKVLPPHPGQNDGFVNRFRLEAKTIARLQHPHILPLYDYGDQDGILYLVMPYVNGGSLAGRIAAGPMPLSGVLDYTRQIAGALDYAHRQGVVHRDLKPENILLDREGHALLADFGIVKLIEGSAPAGTLTVTGGLIGTPAYMSPEQAQGLPVDRRSDLYSLAVVVFEMLTGQQPYKADTAMQVVMQQINAPVPSLRAVSPNVAPALDAVLQKALSKDPAARYPTASELAPALAGAAADQPPLEVAEPSPLATIALTNPGQSTPQPTPTPTAPASPTPSPTNPPVGNTSNTLLLLGGFAIIAVLIVAALVLLTGRNQPSGAASPTVENTAAASAPTRPPQPPVTVAPGFGRAVYSSTAATADTISLQINDVAALPAGSQYMAWLVNTTSGDSRAIGEVNVDAFGSGVLTYTDPDGAFLPGLYNAVALSAETGAAGDTAGPIVYSGSSPALLTQALTDIFVNASLPAADGKPAYEGSLLDGALAEAQIAATHAGLAAGANNVGGLQTHAEHTINILDGTTVDYNNNGRGDNPGRGFGLDYFLNEIERQLDSAAQAPGVGPVMQGQMELIRVCIANARQRKIGIIDLERQLLTAPDLESVASQRAQSTALALALIDGTDLNRNGTVDPFEGECGLSQIATFGLAIASMPLNEGAPG